MRTGKRLSMMPLVLSSDLGSEVNQTVRVVCVHQLESPFATAGRVMLMSDVGAPQSFERALITRHLNDLAKQRRTTELDHAIKRSAKRLKDYRHAIKLARKLLNAW